MRFRTVFTVAFLFLLAGCSSSEQMHQINNQVIELHAGTETSILAHDTTVTFQRPSARSGEQAVLSFKLERNGEPVTALPIMHDKPMHVILVRRDLRYFDHIHPEQREPGVYVAPHTFLSAGEYRVWTDFMSNDMQQLIDFDLKVTGNGVHTPEPDMLDGLKVSFKGSERIMQGKPAELSFTVSDEQEKPVSLTEKFLAAAGHLVVIDATQKEFVHAHDETINGDNVLTFEYTPQTVGKHRMWAQFNYRGKARTAPFEFLVHK